MTEFYQQTCVALVSGCGVIVFAIAFLYLVKQCFEKFIRLIGLRPYIIRAISLMHDEKKVEKDKKSLEVKS